MNKSRLIRQSIAIGIMVASAIIFVASLMSGTGSEDPEAAAAVAGAAANKRLSALVDGIGNAYGLMLGLVATASAAAFGAVISLMRTVTG